MDKPRLEWLRVGKDENILDPITAMPLLTRHQVFRTIVDSLGAITGTVKSSVYNALHTPSEPS